MKSLDQLIYQQMFFILIIRFTLNMFKTIGMVIISVHMICVESALIPTPKQEIINRIKNMS